jgi:type II secretory pathway pseudopilin PulG
MKSNSSQRPLPPCCLGLPRICWRSRRSFTLVELLAVVLVILTLAAIMIGVANAVRLKMDRSATKGDIAALSMAIETYKLDAGAYPTSSPVRVSSIWYSSGQKLWAIAEINNSGLLLSQLTSGSRKYYDFRKGQTNTLSAISPLGGAAPPLVKLPVIVDRWGNPLNYFCTYPRASIATFCSMTICNCCSLYCSTGGQMNVTFDLWSYGPDNVTYLPVAGADWNNPSYAADDITNFKP